MPFLLHKQHHRHDPRMTVLRVGVPFIAPGNLDFIPWYFRELSERAPLNGPRISTIENNYAAWFFLYAHGDVDEVMVSR